MKKHLVDMTIAGEDRTTMEGDVASLEAIVNTFAYLLDDDQRKRLQRYGLRNETFSRGVIDLAKQNPTLVPAHIDMAAIERDLVAREQILPLLFRVQRLVRLLEDTAIALGVDLYEAARGLYKIMQVTAEGSGVADTLAELGRRFARTTSGTASQEPPTPPAVS